MIERETGLNLMFSGECGTCQVYSERTKARTLNIKKPGALSPSHQAFCWPSDLSQGQSFIDF
jgi:hypothetical protein